MFGKKKLYRIRYGMFNDVTLISARNPHQAIRKLQRKFLGHTDIYSIEEVGK